MRDCSLGMHSTRFGKGQDVEPCHRFDLKKIKGKGDACPAFTQHQAKASQTRYLVRWISSVLDGHGAVGRHAILRRRLFSSWCEFENVLDRNGRFLPAAEVELQAQHCENALVCQRALRDDALDEGSTYWHWLPKNHLATHLSFDHAARCNPRVVHAYADEDLVGRMKRLLHRAHGLTFGRIAPLRYIILAGVRWWDRLASIRNV